MKTYRNHRRCPGTRFKARVKDPCHEPGFSLVELLVVPGIIVLLLAIFLPVLSNVRKSSRSTVCLANVQQWGYSYQMYVTSNHGRTLSSEGADWVLNYRWWMWLAPFNGNVRATLLCPEAHEPRSDLRLDETHFIKRGTAVAAWVWKGTKGEEAGSYGFNHWIYRPNSPRNSNPYIRFPAKESARIPLLGDCTTPMPLPIGRGDRVPTSVIDPASGIGGTGVADYCIDRHHMTVNIVFLDGHAEHVPLAELWKLKWSERSQPQDVVLPGN